jgi:hypothetical protein
MLCRIPLNTEELLFLIAISGIGQQQWSPDALASHSGGAQAQVGKVPYEELFYADKVR